MDFYDIDTDYVSQQLTPPKLRTNRFLAWLKVLLKELNFFNTLFYNYRANVSYLNFDITNSYILNDIVIYEDKCVYIYINKISTAGNLPNNPLYWVKAQDNFIGVNNRINGNAQNIIFEYMLNRYFRVPSLDPQIYIQNTTTFVTPFVMGNSGTVSSSMSINSIYQVNYLGNAYTYSSNAYDYTIYVPSSLFITLGSTTINRENAIRNFADLYNLAGMSYQVLTY